MKTSKKVVVLMVILAVLTMACSALRGAESELVQDQDENTGWQTIEIDEVGVNFIVPSSWESLDWEEFNDDIFINYGYESQDEIKGDFGVTCMLVEEFAENVEEYGNPYDPVSWGDRIVDVKAPFADLVLYDKSYDIKGNSAVRIEWENYSEPGLEYETHKILIYTVYKDWLVIIGGQSSQEKWQDYQPYLLNMLDQIDFE